MSPDDPGLQAIILMGQIRDGAVSLDLGAAQIPRLVAESTDPHQLRAVELLRSWIENERKKRAMFGELRGSRSARFSSARYGGEVMVHPSVRGDVEPGSWQVSRFGHDQGQLVPHGHTARVGFEAALREAWEAYGPLDLIQRANPDDRFRELERAAAAGDPSARSALARELSRRGRCSSCGADTPHSGDQSMFGFARTDAGLLLCYACAAVKNLEGMEQSTAKWGGYTAPHSTPWSYSSPVVTNFAGMPLVYGTSRDGHAGFSRSSLHWSGVDRYARPWHGWNGGTNLHTKMNLAKRARVHGREYPGDENGMWAMRLRAAQDEWLERHGRGPLPMAFNPGPTDWAHTPVANRIRMRRPNPGADQAMREAERHARAGDARALGDYVTMAVRRGLPVPIDMLGPIAEGWTVWVTAAYTRNVSTYYYVSLTEEDADLLLVELLTEAALRIRAHHDIEGYEEVMKHLSDGNAGYAADVVEVSLGAYHIQTEVVIGAS